MCTLVCRGCHFDTCIWRDFYESRIGLRGKPLGKYAADLFFNVIKNKAELLFSNLTVSELTRDYEISEIEEMFDCLFSVGILKKIMIEKIVYEEAKEISAEKSIPTSDVVHAILARNNNAIFVSQDKHAQLLKYFVEVKRPEEIN